MKLKLKGQYHIVVKDQDGKIKQDVVVDNVTTSLIHQSIADYMTAATPSTNILFSYIAVGTGTNTPATSDTLLQTETARKVQISRSSAGGIATVSTVFSAGNIPASTLREVGLFAGGTASANTGTLVSRVAVTLVVTALDSVFIDYRLTISDA